MDNAVYQTYAVDENSGIEELDLSVYRYKYLKRLDFQKIGQVTEKEGWFFFNQQQHSFRTLVELVEKLDVLGFRLAYCGHDQYPTIEPYLAIYHEAERKWWEQVIAEEEEKDKAEKRERHAMKRFVKKLEIEGTTDYENANRRN